MARRTRDPLPAPYPVGTRLRCTRASEIAYIRDGRRIIVQAPGLVATVTRTYPGRRGTGRCIGYDDTGARVYDDTSDGYSVAEVEPGAGRCVDPVSDGWEPV